MDFPTGTHKTQYNYATPHTLHASLKSKALHTIKVSAWDTEHHGASFTSKRVKPTEIVQHLTQSTELQL